MNDTPRRSTALRATVRASGVLEPPKTLALRWLLPALAGKGAGHHVALTFDDGPDPASTPAFLDVLDRLGWRATFFMLGSMVERYPSLAAEVASAGHEVASHSYLHESHYFRSPRLVRYDVERSVTVISSATGVRLRWFRPPYGSISAAGLLAARRAGMRMVIWTACGQDWRAGATPQSVAGRVGRNLKAGATVLLHDSDCVASPGSWRSTLGALPLLAELATERGLEVGPLRDHGLDTRNEPLRKAR
jgi:peptidoglycan/xylan/chitin deacetylase (PgdA/CDA1 family)